MTVTDCLDSSLLLLLLCVRLCASFDTPPGATSKASHSGADIHEHFEKAPLSTGQVRTAETHKQSDLVGDWWTLLVLSLQFLMLPCLADSLNGKQERLTAFSKTLSRLKAFPEVQEELPPLLDVLHTGELSNGAVSAGTKTGTENQSSYFTYFIADVSLSLEISRYETLEEFYRKNCNPQNPESAGKSL